MSDPEKYTVGWICALTTEFVAAKTFLDERHDALERPDSKDNNTYQLGKIKGHHVVIACLPKWEYGTTTAATVATNMLRSFPNIRVGLMVGIGGGAPSATHDIRLGDIVVSSRAGAKGGVFQYDYGQAVQKRAFVPTGSLNQPPQALLTALTGLEAQYEEDGHQLDAKIAEVLKSRPRLQEKYGRPDPGSDRLYQSDFIHPDSEQDCEIVCKNASSHLIRRRERSEKSDDDPAVHFGLIASANSLMKDASIRDQMASEHGILCFEMEAAGLMNHFPCLVIRGICDYSDTHKNMRWQGFAAMTAAAFTKDLLGYVTPGRIECEEPLADVLHKIENDLMSVRSCVDETRKNVAILKLDQNAEKMKRWLSPSDYSTNTNLARDRRHPGTGHWFLESSQFREWNSGSQRHLCLFAMAGAGKTVLSTAIHDRLKQSGAFTLLAFFFDFSDSGKQTLEGLLCAFAFQLYCSMRRETNALDRLHTECDEGGQKPGATRLKSCLADMMNESQNVAIIIDAMDECTEQNELLSWIRDSIPDTAKVLVTSRPETIFVKMIPQIWSQHERVDLDKTAINADIRLYVEAEIKKRPDFSGVPEHIKFKIREKVGSGADGMFRWAVCQVDALGKCLSPGDIESALDYLPRTLHETYSRMLDNIPHERKEDAIRLLQFMVHAETPLTLGAAVDIIATKLDPQPGKFDVRYKLFDMGDVRRYCPGLITIPTQPFAVSAIRLAHFSVKEFLLEQEEFHLQKASVVLTRTCLTYLSGIKLCRYYRREFPLAVHAARNWMRYAARAPNFESLVSHIVTFSKEEANLHRWSEIYESGPVSSPKGEPGATDRILPVSALYPVCVGGLTGAARALISEGYDIHASCGLHGSALQAASWYGHTDIVKMLLEAGADVDLQDGHCGNALQVALLQGDLELFRVLHKAGADIDLQGGYYGNALQAASFQGYLEVVRVLLKAGANVTAEGGCFGTALQAASERGNYKIVEVLLQAGADVNYQDGRFGTALQAASERGNLKVVEVLLEAGADVNSQSGRLGTALQVASQWGKLDIVEVLLEAGADVYMEGGIYHNALYAAYTRDLPKIMELLAKKRAGMETAHDPVAAAAGQGNLEVVRLLLLKGVANTSSPGGRYGAALHAASRKGHLEIVELLLEHGADWFYVHFDDSSDPPFSIPLDIAATEGHLEVVRLLLRAVVVKDRGWILEHGGTTLRRASARGQLEIAQLLVDQKIPKWRTSLELRVAAQRDHVETINVLLKCGATDWMNRGHEVARMKGHMAVVEILEEHRAKQDRKEKTSW